MSRIDPFKQLQKESGNKESQTKDVSKELRTLTDTVSQVGRELNALKAIQSHSGPSAEPNEALLRTLWTQVYLSIITQIYEKGLAFWNNKPKNLHNELELAIIRADEAIEAYIRVRNSVPDPVEIAQRRWINEQMNKSL